MLPTIQTNSFLYIAKMLNHYEDRVKKAKGITELKLINEKLKEFKAEITIQLN